MARMTGGQAAVAAQRADGTTHVFGFMDSATMEMFAALNSFRRDSFRHRGV